MKMPTPDSAQESGHLPEETKTKCASKRFLWKKAPSLEVFVKSLIACLVDGSKPKKRLCRLKIILDEDDHLRCLGPAFRQDAQEFMDHFTRKTRWISPQNRFYDLVKFAPPPLFNRMKRSLGAELTSHVNESSEAYALGDEVFAEVAARVSTTKSLRRHCYLLAKGGVVAGEVLRTKITEAKCYSPAEKERRLKKIDTAFGGGDNDAAFFIDPTLPKKKFDACVDRFAKLCGQVMRKFQTDKKWLTKLTKIARAVPESVHFDDEHCSGIAKVSLASQTCNLVIVSSEVTASETETPVRFSDNRWIGGESTSHPGTECCFRLLRLKIMYDVQNIFYYRRKSSLKPCETPRPKTYPFQVGAELFDMGIAGYRDYENEQFFRTSSHKHLEQVRVANLENCRRRGSQLSQQDHPATRQSLDDNVRSPDSDGRIQRARRQFDCLKHLATCLLSELRTVTSVALTLLRNHIGYHRCEEHGDRNEFYPPTEPL